MPPAQIGAPVLARLLRGAATREWAESKFAQAFTPDGRRRATRSSIVALAGDPARAALVKFLRRRQRRSRRPTDRRSIEHKHGGSPRASSGRSPSSASAPRRRSAPAGSRRRSRTAAHRRGQALARRRHARRRQARRRVGQGPGREAAAARARARASLGDRRLVTPARIGLDWLLDLARSADQELHQFAHRLLLEHFAPEDFAGPGASRAAGIDRLWELAAGQGSPEQVRPFAQTYLKAHHPTLGPQLAEARPLGIKPRLGARRLSGDAGAAAARRSSAPTCAGSRRRSPARRWCGGAIRRCCTSSRRARIASRARSASSACSALVAPPETAGDARSPPRGSTGGSCSRWRRARTRPRARSR